MVSLHASVCGLSCAERRDLIAVCGECRETRWRSLPQVIAACVGWLRSATHGVALRGDAREADRWLLPQRGATYPPGTPLGDSTSCHSCAWRQRKLAIEAAR